MPRAHPRALLARSSRAGARPGGPRGGPVARPRAPPLPQRLTRACAGAPCPGRPSTATLCLSRGSPSFLWHSSSRPIPPAPPGSRGPAPRKTRASTPLSTQHHQRRLCAWVYPSCRHSGSSCRHFGSSCRHFGSSCRHFGRAAYRSQRAQATRFAGCCSSMHAAWGCAAQARRAPAPSLRCKTARMKGSLGGCGCCWAPRRHSTTRRGAARGRAFLSRGCVPPPVLVCTCVI